MRYETLEEFKTNSNIETIQGLIKANGGYVTSRQLTELGIHRMYLKKMLDRKLIKKVTKGVYTSTDTIEDNYYTIQLRYPKIIYSQFTALFFQNLTEIYPDSFDITVDYNYHVEDIEKNYNVTKCKKDILDLGLIEISTPLGHKVKAYDPERCICDIIKYQYKLDNEQIKKSVRMYVDNPKNNISNLIKYSKKLGVYNKVMNYVGMYYE